MACPASHSSQGGLFTHACGALVVERKSPPHFAGPASRKASDLLLLGGDVTQGEDGDRMSWEVSDPHNELVSPSTGSVRWPRILSTPACHPPPQTGLVVTLAFPVLRGCCHPPRTVFQMAVPAFNMSSQNRQQDPYWTVSE